MVGSLGILGAGRVASQVSPVIQAVLACRQLPDPQARLACYDAAVDKLAQAVAGGDLVSFDRQQRQEVRRQAFGFDLPSLSIFNRGEQADEVDRLTLKVVRASRDADGRWIIELEGGQTWRQTDTTFLSRAPREGSVATIRRAALGSFMMSIDGHPGMRVRRQN